MEDWTERYKSCKEFIEKLNNPADDENYDEMNDMIIDLKNDLYDPVFDLLQDLIGEMVIKTSRFKHDQDNYQRHDAILKLLIGEPQLIRPKGIDKKDLEDFDRASAIFKSEKSGMEFGEILANVARERHLPGYKFGQKIPKDISDDDYNKVTALHRKLKRLKDRFKIDKHADSFHLRGGKEFRAMIEVDEAGDFSRSLVCIWIKHNHSQ